LKTTALFIAILFIVILMPLSTPVLAEQNDEPYMPTLPPSDLPDLNDDGEVNIIDAVILMQHVLGIRIITCEDKLQRADVNNDGEVNVRDVVEIFRWSIRPL